jgi:hypothetical protein
VAPAILARYMGRDEAAAFRAGAPQPVLISPSGSSRIP